MYDGLAQFYDLDHAGHDEDLTLYSEFARGVNLPILDIGSGTGRVSLALASAGHDVIGVEPSLAMLKRAHARCEEEKLNHRVVLLHAPAESFTTTRQAGMALFALNTFCHFLTSASQFRALSNVRRHLQPGGLLIIDQWNPLASDAPDSSGQWVMGYRRQDDQGNWVTQSVSSTADAARQLLHTTLMYDTERVTTPKRGARGSQAHSVRLERATTTLQLRYSYRFEIEWLLLATGYTVQAVYGSYNLDEYRASAPRLIWVAHNSESASDETSSAAD